MNNINIKCEELINIINDYIKEEYDYEYADVFEDQIVIHTHDNKIICISLNVESEDE